MKTLQNLKMILKSRQNLRLLQLYCQKLQLKMLQVHHLLQENHVLLKQGNNQGVLIP